MSIEVQGRLRISRPQGGGDERMWVQIQDERAAYWIVGASVSLEDFARCLTGESVECVLQLQNVDKVGTKREVKREIVRVSDRWKPDDFAAYLPSAVAAHEFDGWKGRMDDAMNHHNRCPEQDISVPSPRDGSPIHFRAYWVTYTRNAADPPQETREGLTPEVRRAITQHVWEREGRNS